MAPVNIDPPQVLPVEDPIAAWLHLEHQQPRQVLPDGPHTGQDTYNMGQYAESIVDQAKENEALTMLKEQIEALNQKVAEKADDLTDLQDLSLYPNARLPIGFKLPHIEKFSGSTPPHLHIKAYVRTMQLYGLKEDHLAQGFHQTLTGPAHSWFLSLEKHQVTDWKSIVNEFIRHYKYNEELKVTRKHLEMMKHREDESVSDFITRWRELTAQLVNRIPMEEQLGVVVKNFKPEIRSGMGHQYFER